MARMATGSGLCMLAAALVAGGCDRANVGAGPGDGGALPGDGAAPTDGGAGGNPSGTGQVFMLLDDMEKGQDRPTPVGLASWTVRRADANAPTSGGGEWNFVEPFSGPALSGKGQHLLVNDTAGADLRVDFHGPQFLSGGGSPYPDLSAFAGVAFWSRGVAPGGVLRVAIEDDNVASTESYAETRASAKPWFEHETTLTTEWRRHVLLFDDFRQPGLPDNRLHTQAIWSVHLLAGIDGLGADLWLDDLALLCRGSCPAPAWNLVQTGTGIDDSTLPWTQGDATSPDTGCAAVSALSMTALSNLPADPVEKLFLRVRIPVSPPPLVPAWTWRIQNVDSGALVDAVAIDDSRATVAVSLTQAGRYRIAAHTHHPGIDVCGVEVDANAF